MRRFARSATAAAVAAPVMMQQRTFFGKGWDNAALDTVFRGLLRKPEVNDRLKAVYARGMELRMIEATLRGAARAEEQKSALRVFLPPHLGDPHRLLKAYSLTAYPILDEKGEQLKVSVDGQLLEAFADPDDDYSKVCLPHLELTEFVAQELLTTLSWEATPRGAASLLESLYRGAEIPDHVFQTPAVIDREF